MESKNDGGSAFPMPAAFNEGIGVHCQEYGMTLRDYFAAKAMQGLLAQSNGSALGSNVSLGAEYAYQMADAMLKARGSV